MEKAFHRWLVPVLFPLLLSAGCAAVPPRQPLPPAAFASPGVYHTVEKGQTLWRISRMYGVDIGALAAANGIQDTARIETGRVLRIPPARTPAGMPSDADGYRQVERLVGSPYGSVRWRTITVHHSATRYGNGKVFDRHHRMRGMGGLFYHFLIGNGNGLGDGQIEVGWRWKRQREVNRRRDIQICLVGNFMKQQVSPRQYQALKRLVAVLRRRYGITAPVRRHCDIAPRPTECPGRNFPYSELLADTRKE